jgi:hypothetical protein
MMSEPVFLDALLIVMGTVAFIASLSFLRRLFESRSARRPPVEIGALEARLERIESVVEATAVEVERISEANRFMATLLSDRAGTASPSSSTERVITPH